MFSAKDGSKSHFHIQEDKGKTKVNCAWGEGWQPAKLWKIGHGMESLEGVSFLKGLQRHLLRSLSGALERQYGLCKTLAQTLAQNHGTAE